MVEVSLNTLDKKKTPRPETIRRRFISRRKRNDVAKALARLEAFSSGTDQGGRVETFAPPPSWKDSERF